MFDCNHYVPILLAKRGERIALRELPATIRRGFTPLLEIPQVPVDFDLDDYKDLGPHIKGFPKHLKRDLDGYGRFFLDIPHLIDPEELVDGQHPVSVLFAGCREHNLNAVPVAANQRGEDYNLAVRAVMEADGRGACLRLSKSDLQAHKEVVSRMLGVLDATPKDIDLILDLGSIEPSNVSIYATALQRILPKPTFSKRSWRSLTIASGAFPQNLGDLPQGLSALPRADWELWARIRNEPPPSARVPTFGDYVINSPEWVTALTLDI